LAKPAFVADENLHANIINSMRDAGIEVFSIRETMAGASDRDVLEKARSMSAILITEDSDFGELVFSHGIPAVGIVYLRYNWDEVQAIAKAVVTLASSRILSGSFFTLTTKKIRERSLP